MKNARKFNSTQSKWSERLSYHLDCSKRCVQSVTVHNLIIGYFVTERGCETQKRMETEVDQIWAK